jgi:hypothetical protein
MVMMVMRKMVTKIALLRSGFQYVMVMEAAMISSGKTMSHCNA